MKALIVDDDVDFRGFLAELLLNKGLTVTVASNGNEAIKVMKDVDPDVLFLDLKMPNSDGIEVLRFIAKQQKHPEVVICSGYLQSYQVNYADLLAGTYKLPKPFELQQLKDIFIALGV